MASELRVNTLKDAAGNNSIATSFVAGGSAKVWVSFNATPTIGDSLNVSSLTDNATGRPQVNFSNALANANYATSGLCGAGQTTNPAALTFDTAGGLQTTGSVGVVTSEGSDSKKDYQLTTVSVNGDLA